jgi:hypothetical protein
MGKLQRSGGGSVILDIDLDYFVVLKQPVREFKKILGWASHPIDHLVDHHHQSYKHWLQMMARGTLTHPRLIVHIDDHHDMFSDKPPVNSGNFIYFALRRFPQCHVIWVAPDPIDYPDMWLSHSAWASVSQRFECSTKLDRHLPKPDVVSVCRSPAFVEKNLGKALLSHSRYHQARS